MHIVKQFDIQLNESHVKVTRAPNGFDFITEEIKPNYVMIQNDPRIAREEKK